MWRQKEEANRFAKLLCFAPELKVIHAPHMIWALMRADLENVQRKIKTTVTLYKFLLDEILESQPIVKKREISDN